MLISESSLYIKINEIMLILLNVFYTVKSTDDSQNRYHCYFFYNIIEKLANLYLWIEPMWSVYLGAYMRFVYAKIIVVSII